MSLPQKTKNLLMLGGTVAGLFWSCGVGWAQEVTEEPETQTSATNVTAEEETSQALPESAPPPPPLPTGRKELLSLLNEAQMAQAVQALREHFIQPGALSERELKRAQLHGLLERLGPGVNLAPQRGEGEKQEEPHPFLAEVIDGRVGYIRLSAVDPGDVAQLDAVLADFREKGLGAVVLDLRAIPHGGDFEAAADMARRFTPKGKLLFRLDRPGAKQERIFTANQEPVFQGILVVLTDDATAGAAEVLAGVLRQAAGALVVGLTTAGQPVEYARFDLGGRVELQVAVAEAILGEEGRLFPAGAKPDLELGLPPGVREEIFALSSERGVSEFIFEKERPRMNEAALISNLNPELDPGQETPRPENTPQDRVLQRAVDIITALQLFQKPADS
jgi:hypothetical protein